MRIIPIALLALAALCPLTAQVAKPKDVREAAKAGSAAIPKLQEFLKNPSSDVRNQAVRELIDIDLPRCIDPLIQATRDNDPEIQLLATDGLVNFYSPGYVKGGVASTVRRVATAIRSKFTDTNDLVIDPFVEVRPEVIAALARLVTGGASLESRANAAHAVGILRGKAAVEQLVEGVHSKDTDLIYESLVALQKIRDEAAVPDLVDALNRARDPKVKREALTAIAMLPVEQSRALYTQYLHDKDDRLRAPAAEGFARLRNMADLPMLEKAWKDEQKASPRLSLAFAQVMLGKTGLSEFSPLRYLINNLNSAAYTGVALPFLTELARDPAIRQALYPPIAGGTRDVKIGLARVLAVSGDSSSLDVLQRLSKDTDPQVAQAGLRALRSLQSRM